MLKLDMILENVRNQYTLGLLEESTLSEKDILQGKMMINESTMSIRKILVDEGVIEETRSMLQEAWEDMVQTAQGLYPEEDEGITAGEAAAVGLGAAGLGAAGYRYGGKTGATVLANGMRNPNMSVGEAMNAGARAVKTQAGATMRSDVARARNAVNDQIASVKADFGKGRVAAQHPGRFRPKSQSISYRAGLFRG